MESLRTQYAQATEPASRQQIAAKIQQLAYDQVFYIPLGTYSNYAARRSNVTPLLDAPVTVFWEYPRTESPRGAAMAPRST